MITGLSKRVGFSWRLKLSFKLVYPETLTQPAVNPLNSALRVLRHSLWHTGSKQTIIEPYHRSIRRRIKTHHVVHGLFALIIIAGIIYRIIR